ncbi:unnamed protein product [Closterium sp. Naga37s-1]|nr:unnamed protein product [Closterium sp. Naga37s-1]
MPCSVFPLYRFPHPSQTFAAEGEQVKVLTRSVDRAKEVFAGEEYGLVFEGAGTEGVELVGPEGWAAAVAGSGSVVNLAGTPISTRWSPAIKAEIISSRVDTTAKIVEAINSLPKDKRPSVLVNTSAVGFYVLFRINLTPFSRLLTPPLLPPPPFSHQVCTKWEAEAQKVSPDSTRLAIIRFGVVLDKGGGALGKMLPIFQLFAGGPLGTGQQWASWHWIAVVVSGIAVVVSGIAVVVSGIAVVVSGIAVVVNGIAAVLILTRDGVALGKILPILQL